LLLLSDLGLLGKADTSRSFSKGGSGFSLYLFISHFVVLNICLWKIKRMSLQSLTHFFKDKEVAFRCLISDKKKDLKNYEIVLVD